MTTDRNMSDGSFDEKQINDQVISAPPSENDVLVKDWDEEESAVRRKYVNPIQSRAQTNRSHSESTSS